MINMGGKTTLVAGTAAFSASGRVSFATGQYGIEDGGLTIW